MAVAFDNSNFVDLILSGVDGPSHPATMNITHLDSTNSFLLVFIEWVEQAGNNANDNAIEVTQCNFNNVGMTYVTQIDSGTYHITIYRAVGTSGSHNVEVRWDLPDDPGANMFMTAVVTGLTFTGVNQTTPIVQSGSASGSGTAVTKTLTGCVVGNMLADALIGKLSTSANVGADQTVRSTDHQVGTLGALFRAAVSTQDATAGSNVMSWTLGTSRVWFQYVLEIGAAAVSSVSRTLVGVGR